MQSITNICNNYELSSSANLKIFFFISLFLSQNPNFAYNLYTISFEVRVLRYESLHRLLRAVRAHSVAQIELLRQAVRL